MNGDFALDFILRRGTPAEEIGQLLERMDGLDIFAVSLWALPEGKRLDDVDLKAWPKEYIQCAGSANRLTVEIRRVESGTPHQFVIGRTAEPGTETEIVRLGFRAALGDGVAERAPDLE